MQVNRDDGVSGSSKRSTPHPESRQSETPSSTRTESTGDAATSSTAVSAFQQYTERTELSKTFLSLCHILLKRTDLPYNPYPRFSQRLRVKAEMFPMMFHLPDAEIRRRLVSSVAHSTITHLAHPMNCNFVWGLRHLIEVVEPVVLQQYQWLVSTASPHQLTLENDALYSNQVMCALTGPVIFHGTFYSEPHVVNIRVEYLISGPNVEMAINLFVASLVNDLRQMERDGHHFVFGINLPVRDKEVVDHWQKQYWTVEAVFMAEDDFKYAAVDAVTQKKQINAECLFKVSKQGDRYKRGTKEYLLNVLQTSDLVGGKEKLHYFTEHPLTTMYEGVFFNQSHAEAYMAVFAPRFNISDGKRSVPSTAKGTPTTPSSRKVRVDGFRFVDDESTTGYNWQQHDPVRTTWENRIAELHLESDFFDVLHTVILLSLHDGTENSWKILVEVYRLLRSTAYRFFTAMLLNKTLRETISKHLGYETSDLVQTIHRDYEKRLIDLLDHEHNDRSSDLITVGKSALFRVEQLTADTKILLVNDSVLSKLKEVNIYCYASLLQLDEDIMDKTICPQLLELLQTLRQDSDELQKQTANDQAALQSSEPFKHGHEEEAIMLHDKQVINIEMCMERDSAPKSIGVEAVALRYITDLHLDTVWTNYLLDLMLAPTLHPNPYPSLVTVLRQNAMRMDLCYDSGSLLSQLLQGTARQEDQRNYIYHIPGCNVHGHQTALALLDQAVYFDLVPRIEPFILTRFLQRRGQYRLAVCCAVSNFTPLYGKMDPYLKEINLQEYYYIRGPSGCQMEAMQIYSKTVYEHILALKKDAEIPVTGIYMGTDPVRWQLHQALQNKKAFASEIERYCQLKEPLYIKMLLKLDWRYVSVIKYINFSFVDEGEMHHEHFFPENPVLLYQNVFFEKERAAFHYQHSGSLTGTDPLNASCVRAACRWLDRAVLDVSRRQDWLATYRLLLLRNIMHQGTSLVEEVWRMLHSAAAEMEYVITLANSLQDIVNYLLEQQTLAEEKMAAMVPREETVATIKTSKSSHKNTATLPAKYQMPQLEKSVLVQTVESQFCLMTEAFITKLDAACKRATSITCPSLLRVCQQKLNSILQPGGADGYRCLKLNLHTVYTLEQMTCILRNVQDCAAQDVHAICPEAQACLRSIEADYKKRPTEKESVWHYDPTVYLTRPLAKIPAHVDEWLPI